MRPLRLERLGGDAAKERGEPDPVVDVDARSAAADGVERAEDQDAAWRSESMMPSQWY